MSNIISLDQIKKDIEYVEQNGKDIILGGQVDEALGKLKLAEKQIGEIVKYLKEHIKEASEPFNAKTIRGKYCTISIGKPRGKSQYQYDDNLASNFIKKKVTYELDIEAVEKYIEENNQLPEGVIKINPQPTVSIRLKSEAESLMEG